MLGNLDRHRRFKSWLMCLSGAEEEIPYRYDPFRPARWDTFALARQD